MPDARNFFAGSLVDGLLRDLAAEQHAAPELIDVLSVDNVRWNLERLASTRVAAHGDANDPVVEAVSAATDDTLETLLEVSADWHSDGHGAWCVHDSVPSAVAAAGAALLDTRRAQASKHVERERDLTYLVQLPHRAHRAAAVRRFRHAARDAPRQVEPAAEKGVRPRRRGARPGGARARARGAEAAMNIA